MYYTVNTKNIITKLRARSARPCKNVLKVVVFKL